MKNNNINAHVAITYMKREIRKSSNLWTLYILDVINLTHTHTHTHTRFTSQFHTMIAISQEKT